jgi:cytochrome c oxidase subunit 4
MTKPPAPAADAFIAEARGLMLCWLALLALMTTSLGGAYLRLGVGNVFVALGIAVIKTGIVGWWFMHLRHASATTRLAAGVALVMLAILLTLSGVDYLTRVDEPAALQAPAQIEPIIRGKGLPN